MNTKTYTIKGSNRNMAREIFTFSNAKHNTDVEEIKSFTRSTFLVTGTEYAIRVLDMALEGLAV